MSSPEARGKLRLYLDRYRNREYKDTPLLDHFSDLTDIIGASSYEGDTFKASLLLIYDVLLRKEQERKAPELTHTSAYRDGLDVMNFLMDLINHIAGYTHKYYEELRDQIDHEGLVQKYRSELSKCEGRVHES